MPETVFSTPPPNSVIVSSYAVGFGDVTGITEDGVSRQGLIAILTNDGDGPMLLLHPTAAAQMAIDIVHALPDAAERVSPKVAAELRAILGPRRSWWRRR